MATTSCSHGVLEIKQLEAAGLHPSAAHHLARVNGFLQGYELQSQRQLYKLLLQAEMEQEFFSSTTQLQRDTEYGK